VHTNQVGTNFETEFPHANQVLVNLGETLFIFVDQEFRPVLKLLVDQLQSLLVTLRQLDFLPQLVWCVSTFDCLHVQVADTFILLDSRISTVREGAVLFGAQASDVVRVPAKIL